MTAVTEPTLDAQAPDGPDPEGAPARALRAVTAETAAEQTAAGDGSVTVTLRTEYGQADIQVPPMRKWRSVAKSALFNREDDLTWAGQTLSPEDVMSWVQLNPTGEDTANFFDEWGSKTGQALGEALASRRR
jgi:hypothetical protein